MLTARGYTNIYVRIMLDHIKIADLENAGTLELQRCKYIQHLYATHVEVFVSVVVHKLGK